MSLFLKSGLYVSFYVQTYKWNTAETHQIYRNKYIFQKEDNPD